MTSIQRRRTLDFDVAVVGGGLAGICAATAAARNGARTALIQDRPVLGGNSSSEIRVHANGVTHLKPDGIPERETGIIEEILLHQHIASYPIVVRGVDPIIIEFFPGWGDLPIVSFCDHVQVHGPVKWRLAIFGAGIDGEFILAIVVELDGICIHPPGSIHMEGIPSRRRNLRFAIYTLIDPLPRA